MVLLGLLMGVAMVGCGNSGDPFSVFEISPRVPVMVSNPPAGATGVSVHTLVTVAFPAALDPTSVSQGTVNLVGPSGLPVARTVTYDATSRVITIRPVNPLEPNAFYQVSVQGVRPLDRTFSYSAAVFTFGTGDDPATGAPEVIAVSPVPDQANVNVAAPVILTFSEAMDPNSVIRAFSISNGISGTFAFNPGFTQVTFTPGAPMPLGANVQVQLSRLATDVDGVPLRVGFASSFRTPIPGSFRVVASVPADGATTASPSDPLRFTFSEPVDRSTIATGFLISNDTLAIPAPTAANFSFANNDQVVFYDPRPSIPGFVGFPGGSNMRTTFTVNVHSAVSGIGLDRQFRANFQIEQIAPQVILTVPANGSVNVPAQQVIRVTFSEPIDRNTVDGTSFQVSQGAVVAGALSFENGDRTVVFTPAMDLQNVGVPVQVDITTAITDLGGTALSAAFVLSFSVDTMPPFTTTIFPLNPPDVPVTLAPNRNISFVFNEDLDQAATSASFMIAPNGGGGQVQFPNSTTLVYTPPVIMPPVNQPTAPNRKLLTGNTNYMVSFTAFDLAGNQTPIMHAFQTDTQPPNGIGSPMGTTTMTQPAVGVLFNELMDKDTLMAVGGVTFRQIVPAMVTIPVTLVVADSAVSFTPPVLTVGNTYEVLVDTTVTDLGGLPLAGPIQFQFQVTP